MPRHLLLAALLALFLFPDRTVAANKTTAHHQPRPATATAKAAPSKHNAPRPAKQTKKTGPPRFVHLNRASAANEVLFDPFADPGGNAFDMEPAYTPAPPRPSSPGKAGAQANGGGHAAGKAPLAYRYPVGGNTKASLNAGVGWIQNLDDAAGMRPSQKEPGNDGSITNRSPGVNLSLGASYKALTLTGGYIRALDNHASADQTMTGAERNATAWNSELAYATELLNREATLAVGYQRSLEAFHSYLPDERYRTRASIALTNSTFFSLEYYLDKSDSATNNGTDGYGIATKIGFDF